MALFVDIRRKLVDLLKEDYLEETSDKFNRFFIRIRPGRVREVTRLLVEGLDGRLAAISANDCGFLGFDLVYHFDFSHQERGLHLSVKARVSRDNPVIDSVAGIAWSANWAERELIDLMGIKFAGHPDPRRLFLPYAWPSEEVA